MRPAKSAAVGYTRFSPMPRFFPAEPPLPRWSHISAKTPMGHGIKKPQKMAEKLPPEQAQFAEWGDMPQAPKSGTLSSPNNLVGAIRDGLTDYDLINLDPAVWKHLTAIRQMRGVLKGEEFLKKRWDVKVVYIEGASGTGKNRDVLLAENYEVFSIDDYDHVWDNYSQEDAVFFDEFRSQVALSEMLRWLDGNPVRLKARYANAVACYTRVYIASNWKLEGQYEVKQAAHARDWQAFLRCISEQRKYNLDGTIDIFVNQNNTWVHDRKIENALSEQEGCDTK